MSSLDFIHQPIHAIRKALQNRHVSAVDLMRFIIGRIERVNPSLNALIDERFDDALKEAHQADTSLRRGDTRPLLGIPFTVKSNISVRGLRHDLGSWAFHGRRASTDATVVARLTAAGAIPVGVTNVSEMALWHETANPIHGRTSNPWSLSRSPGGSSGGEAALVAAGATIFGVGTDLGGSIRIPASFCGVFGHRPSRGLVPLTGQFPYYKSTDEIGLRVFDSIGPITRYAEDLGLLLEVTAGTCSGDPVSRQGELHPFDVQWNGKRVAIIEDPKCELISRTAPELRLAVKRAARRLADHGAEVVTAPDDLLYDAFRLWRHHLHLATNGEFRKMFGAGKKRNSFVEFLKCLTGNSDHSLSACMFMFSEEWMIDSKTIKDFEFLTRKTKERLDRLFKTADILILPAHPEVAPRHLVSMLKPFNPGITGLNRPIILRK